MTVNIVPYVSVNEIMFGMTSLEITLLLKKNPKKFRKTSNDLYESDDYDTFFIYYNDEGGCEAVEFGDNSCLKLFGIPVFSTDYDDLINMILRFDKKIMLLEDGLISNKYGFSIYIPNKSNSHIESILFFDRDYWE